MSLASKGTTLSCLNHSSWLRAARGNRSTWVRPRCPYDRSQARPHFLRTPFLQLQTEKGRTEFRLIRHNRLDDQFLEGDLFALYGNLKTLSGEGYTDFEFSKGKDEVVEEFRIDGPELRAQLKRVWVKGV